MRAALSFLTVLPVGRSDARPSGAAVVFFPLAGAVLGGAWALCAWAGTKLWGPVAAAGCVIFLDLVLTGALHLDAFADVADGLASRQPTRAVEIMRDPRVGAAGASALASVLLLRFAWLEVAAQTAVFALLLAAPAAGRGAMVVVLALGIQPQRASLAGALMATTGRATVATSCVLSAVICIAAGAVQAKLAGALLGAGAWLAALIVAVACERLWRRRFGALSGDACGAAGLCAESAALAVIASAWLVLGH